MWVQYADAKRDRARAPGKSTSIDAFSTTTSRWQPQSRIAIALTYLVLRGTLQASKEDAA